MGGRGSSGGKGSRNSNINNSNEFKSGDIVRIKPEFCDTPSEADNIYLIREMRVNSYTERCIIQPLTGPSSKLPIVPSQTVGLNMLKHTGINVNEYLKKEK